MKTFSTFAEVPMSVVRRILLMVVLALVAAAPLAAQTTVGTVRGYVRDPGGAPVPEVQVSAELVGTGITRTVMTNASGFYSIPGLRPGQYQVTVRRIGFAEQRRTVQVPIAQTVTAEFAMQESATQLGPVVIAGQAGATARTSEVGSNVSREQIENLPVFDRNFLDLARLVPGVTTPAVNNQDKFLAAGGQPAEAVNVFVDGATYKNDVLRGGVVGQDASKGNPFPQGAVQEFRVITQNYKAEYQKASSAIITATTRSGTNLWEIDAFAYGVGNGYVARDPIAVRNAAGRSNYKRLQTGGSAGGPIISDRLFFFGTYELTARDEPQFVTPGGAAGQLPASVNVNQYAGEFTSQFRQHMGFGKLTWAQSDRSTVDGSLSIRHETDFRGFGGETSFESAENVAIDVINAGTIWRYAGDRWLNEAQINFQHFVWEPQPLNPGLVGRQYLGGIRIGGRDSRQEFTQRRLSLRNDVTRSGVQWNGDHVFKAGVSVDLLGYRAEKELFGNPVFRYRSDEDYQRPFEAAFGFGDPRISASNTQLGLFAQDDWSIGRLVLNLGVRWDVETNMINNQYVTPRALADSLRGPLASQFFVDVPRMKSDGTCCDFTRRNVLNELGGIDRYITTGRDDRPMYLGAIQPRLGASYDLAGNGSTVLFAGAGVYFDRAYWNTLLDEQYRRQYRVLTARFNETGPTEDCPLCVAWDPRYLDPAQLRTLSGTFASPEVFLVANDLRPPRSHQFTGGVRQALGPTQLTVSYNGVRGYDRMNYIRATPWGGLGPNYSTAFIADDRVRTWYDALQLQLERPMRGVSRWGGALAYTFGTTREQGQSTDIFWPFDERHPTVGDLPTRRAPGDQSHTIVANAILRLPYDVLFSGIANLGTGHTVNATDARMGWDLAAQRTYVYEAPLRPFLGIGRVFNNQNLDMRLEKGFGLTSGQRVAVTADLFNAFNSSNWGCYDATIFPSSGTANPNYGRPNCAALGRRLQVGLRYGLRPERDGEM